MEMPSDEAWARNTALTRRHGRIPSIALWDEDSVGPPVGWPTWWRNFFSSPPNNMPRRRGRGGRGRRQSPGSATTPATPATPEPAATPTSPPGAPTRSDVEPMELDPPPYVAPAPPPLARGGFSAAAELEGDVAPERVARYHERRARLDQFMQEHYHLGVRDDSMLAYRFCMGDDDLDSMWEDTEVVAHELACIQLIHQLTPYDDVCQTAMREMAGVLHHTGRMQWGDAWKRVRAYGPSIVKVAAALSCEAGLPQMSAQID